MTAAPWKHFHTMLREGLKDSKPQVNGTVVTGQICDWIVVNKLEPLFYSWGYDTPEHVFKKAYCQNLVRAERLLQQGLALVKAMEQAGVSVIPLKGPFDGVRYYGDSATRYSADIDLLVRERQLDCAVKSAIDVGFRLRFKEMPFHYYRAIHLHFPMVHDRSGVLCDLHWRLDHPFRLYRIDYDHLFSVAENQSFPSGAWRCLPASIRFLVACIHAAKEWNLAPNKTVDIVSLTLSGNLRPLLDLTQIASMIEGEAEWKAISAMAQQWRMSHEYAVIVGLLRCFNADQAMVTEIDGRHAGLANESRWSARLGFRPSRFKNVLSYIFPPPAFFMSSRYRFILRCRHALAALKHLIAAFGTALGCLLIWRWRLLKGGETP